MYIMLTFIVFPKYLHLIYLQRICYLSLYSSCLHFENETCTLGLLTFSSTYIQTNHLTSVIFMLLPELRIRGVYLETQDQDKNKLHVSDVVYGCNASIILQ